MFWAFYAMALLGTTGVVVVVAYGIGYGHGRQEALSETYDRRRKRCTPEPARLRLVGYRHPVFFDQDDIA